MIMMKIRFSFISKHCIRNFVFGSRMHNSSCQNFLTSTFSYLSLTVFNQFIYFRIFNKIVRLSSSFLTIIAISVLTVKII